ncbi:hypothetical protein ILUMI_23024 [Ignelater luminosus]|uniref:HTH psq-type domain-containing protein n=1 Tax=Ignelater luminosus TaxID=2038154 RepID=A0A8K0G220_IGNLU|nr:hypothetical protein ILUMI_23024 [Ignelater luminosus]
MPATYKRITAREWNSTNTRKAIEAVLQNKLSIKNAAKEFRKKKSRLDYLVKRAREDVIDKVALDPDFRKSAIFTNTYIIHPKIRNRNFYGAKRPEGLKQKRRQTGSFGRKERTVTQVGIISAIDNALPPIWLLPRVSYPKTGILSFDPNIFKDIDFMSFFVSDREAHLVPSISAAESTYADMTGQHYQSLCSNDTISPQEGNFPVAKTSTSAIPAQLSMENTVIRLVSPKDIHPYPNEQTRKEAGKNSDKEEPEEENIDLASPTVGDWVALKYNGDLFPGQIKFINGSNELIQCLKKQEKYYKWPVRNDIMEY